MIQQQEIRKFQDQHISYHQDVKLIFQDQHISYHQDVKLILINALHHRTMLIDVDQNASSQNIQYHQRRNYSVKASILLNLELLY
ncbi:unnamed protein product [Paramecium sonneborni]|uniref:Uncharacterized protein n=1 Tax=Paramecium sonneborni TaxID=65129 RepID=A0A8S1MA58_9CILI|nr:unnamed protein product [Paramecium sonneborni]